MNLTDLASRIADLPDVDEAGRWQRHAAARLAPQALDGWTDYGRWGTRAGFPVLYLGRPTDSVVIEAYRHQVDPVIFDSPEDRERFLAGLLPRVLVTCEVDVSRLVDLRSPGARGTVGLIATDLTSPVNDRESHRRCQEVAQVAHQLGRHGIITPAATGAGETLALFTDLLPEGERPVRIVDDVLWPRLPPDPREVPSPRLRVVRNED